MGERRKVYRVDFSVGARASQKDHLKYRFSLAALRVPEWELVLDKQCICPPG